MVLRCNKSELSRKTFGAILKRIITDRAIGCTKYFYRQSKISIGAGGTMRKPEDRYIIIGFDVNTQLLNLLAEEQFDRGVEVDGGNLGRFEMKRNAFVKPRD